MRRAKPADADYATPQMRRSGSSGWGPDGFAGGSVPSGGGSVGPGSGSKWSEHPTPGSGYPDRSAGKPCHACGEIGHLVRDCPARRCRGCGGFGHVVRDCPSAQPYAPRRSNRALRRRRTCPVLLSSIAPGGKPDRWDDAPGASAPRLKILAAAGAASCVTETFPPPRRRVGRPGGISAAGDGRGRPRAEVGGGAEATAASAAHAAVASQWNLQQ